MIISRFPNLVVGVLTRESVRQALRGGITAQQIIHYLEQHSHPQVLIIFTLSDLLVQLPVGLTT